MMIIIIKDSTCMFITSIQYHIIMTGTLSKKNTIGSGWSPSLHPTLRCHHLYTIQCHAASTSTLNTTFTLWLNTTLLLPLQPVLRCHQPPPCQMLHCHPRNSALRWLMMWSPVCHFTDRWNKIVTLQASLSGTFLQTLPELITPLKRHSLPPHSCWVLVKQWKQRSIQAHT